MDPNPNPTATATAQSSEIAHDFSPLLKVYKDGKIQRLMGNDTVPSSLDATTNVESKDVLYSPENALSVRLYIPGQQTTNGGQSKLPLLVYFHGGGFCIETAFSPTYHNYLNAFVSKSNVVAVSVDYRKAPEHPVPAAYDDSWAAIKWVASHAKGEGPEDWLNRYADLERVFFSGDSAGANISHHMAMGIGREVPDGGSVSLNLVGLVLIHPYFWGTEPVADETTDVKLRAFTEQLWRFTCPGTSGCDDTWINPVGDWSERLAGLGCGRVLICVAEKDLLRARGWWYYEKLKESGWGGDVEVYESKGEPHVFHLFNPVCDNAVAMLERIAAFLNLM